MSNGVFRFDSRDVTRYISTIVALFQRAGRVVFTGTKLLVEHNHATDMVADHRGLTYQVAGILFFFHLFVDEPSM